MNSEFAERKLMVYDAEVDDDGKRVVGVPWVQNWTCEVIDVNRSNGNFGEIVEITGIARVDAIPK